MIQTAEDLKLLNYMINIMIAFYALCAVHYGARWNLFKKAGIGGWKALIPFYTDYLFFKLAWRAKYYWWCLGLQVLSSVMGNYNIFFIDILGTLGLCVFWILLNAKLAEKFSKGKGFLLGLIFLNPVFMLILAFGKSKYRGNREENL